MPDFGPARQVELALRSERILSKSSIPSSPRSGHVEHASVIDQVEEVIDTAEDNGLAASVHSPLRGEHVVDRPIRDVGPLDQSEQLPVQSAKPPVRFDLFAVDPL